MFDVPNGDVTALVVAINLANGNTEADTINLAPAGTYTLTASDGAGNGLPVIASNITVNGSGATIQRSSTASAFRILFITGQLTLKSVTIRGGNLTGAGGGIYNAGILTLEDSVVTGNAASAAGGIYNHFGTLTLDHSTVRGNDGGNGAGGIYNHFGAVVLNDSTVSSNTAGGIGGIRSSAGTLTLNNSTVSGNVAGHNIAGGILNDCAGGGTDADHIVATTILNNSTVSGNSAVTYGGGIVNISARLRGCSGATVILNNSTITANSAASGGGIVQDPRNNNPATVILKNSIVADNTGSPKDCRGLITSQGYNLDSDNSCGLSPAIGDIPNASPRMLALAQNPPGSTNTHALCVADGIPSPSCTGASPAIDAVPRGSCTASTDQRGVARPQGTACDIGAYEVVFDPAQSINDLIPMIIGMGLSNGVTNSLVGPLGQASTLLTDNNPNNDVAACGKLDAFIAQVNAKLQNGQLTSVQADVLLQAANGITANLAC